MSTRLYAYKVEKDRWWDFIDRLNEFYWKDDPITNTIRKALRDKDGHDIDTVTTMLKELESIFKKDTLQVDLQVFEYSPTHYIFRVLETGYYFMNNHEKFDVTPVFYDDRSDVPEEDKLNLEVSEQVDVLIQNKHYFIYPVVTEQWAFDLWEEWRQEVIKQK